MGTYDQFWNSVKNAGPGLFDLGVGAYTRNQAQREAAGRLDAARGPVYNSAMGGAQSTLAQAGNFDPNAFATNRFNQAQGMLAGGDSASMDDLMRRLRASGQSDISSFSGQAPGGPAVNPQMAAFFKAKADRDAKMAYDAQGQGDAQLDNMIKRSGMLSDQAGRVQNAGLVGQRTQPSRATGNAEFLKGGIGVLKDSGVLKQLPGMFSSGVDWLKKKFDFGGGSSPMVGDFGGGGYGNFSDWA